VVLKLLEHILFFSMYIIGLVGGKYRIFSWALLAKCRVLLLQEERLSGPPPLYLDQAPPPSQTECDIADRVQVTRCLSEFLGRGYIFPRSPTFLNYKCNIVVFGPLTVSHPFLIFSIVACIMVQELYIPLRLKMVLFSPLIFPLFLFISPLMF
jgi:hypothetical protein